MRFWIRTRGQRYDYRFLGQSGEPSRFWSPWLGLTAPEERTLLALTDEMGWRLYVTAMESGRIDGASPPRAIRNSLVVHGNRDEGERLAALVSAWFSGRLAALLAAHLPEEAVDGWLAASVLAEEARCALEEALCAVPCDVLPEARPGTWTGAPDAISAQQQLVSAIRDAAERGVSGIAAQLNLMSAPGEAAALSEAASVQIFLLDGAPETLTEEAPGERGKNPPRAGPSQTEAGRRRREAGILWMFLLIWDLVYGLGRRTSGGR